MVESQLLPVRRHQHRHCLTNILSVPQPLDHVSFHIQLAEQLVGDFCSWKAMGRPSLEQSLTGRHFLEKGASQKCTVCVRTYKTKNMKQPMASSNWCHGCQPLVPLCVDPCNKIWHTKRNFLEIFDLSK